MSFIATVIAILVLGNLLWWWRAHRLLAPLKRRRIWRTLLAAFFILQISGLSLVILTRFHTTLIDALASGPMMAAIYIWHVFILVPLLLVWPVAELIRGIGALVRRLFAVAPAKPRKEGLTRREFLGASAAVAPTVLSLTATAVAIPQLDRFRIRRIDVPLATLPAALDGLTIAHVSDVHVGRFTQGTVLDRIAQATNDLHADLVLLTGDLINFALSDLPVALDLVRKMRGRFGVFMCEGNHDLIENGATFERETRAAGVPLLLDESAVLEVRGTAVEVLGLRWGAPGARSRAEKHGDAAISASMRGLLSRRQREAFPILLAHHPHAFDFADDVPLTLAGHTHGGQLMLSPNVGFGPWMFRYWSGLYREKGRALVVSNGVGNWFPLRIEAPAEIIHLTLRRAV